MGAVISPCELYRYALWRQWDASLPLLAFIMLNPSKADARIDDQTIRLCMAWARRMGYGGILVMNLFAYRATSPQDMLSAVDPVGPENDAYLRRLLVLPKRIAAWGTHGAHLGRDRVVRQMLGEPLWALQLTKEGHPRHPLRIPYSTQPVKL